MRSTSQVWFVGKDGSCIRRAWTSRLHSYRLHKDDSIWRIVALLVCDRPASPRGRASDRASDDRCAVGFSANSRNRRCDQRLRAFSGLRCKSTSSDPARPAVATLKQIVCRQFSPSPPGSANTCLTTRSIAPDPSRLISVAGYLFQGGASRAFPKPRPGVLALPVLKCRLRDPGPGAQCLTKSLTRIRRKAALESTPLGKRSAAQHLD